MTHDVYLHAVNSLSNGVSYLLITERDKRHKHPAWLGIRAYCETVTDKDVGQITSKSKTFKSLKNSITNSEEHKKLERPLRSFLIAVKAFRRRVRSELFYGLSTPNFWMLVGTMLMWIKLLR